ncbi:cell division suppressor protein YneA [Listeria ilorinensis]|uniref:cell division suppressor protein YneA n=1 Tax=Listeria ilorinensis TaxID=2867439 RepID=UPI001EF6852F|nr:LysM peptidoglycan-binding domain-containing protein [Listeria ilorinensis]
MSLKAIWDKHYATVIVLVGCVAMGIILMLFLADSDTENYSEIAINEGDSVWALAADYADESHMSQEEFVQWVEKENHLADGQIQTGDSLIIPVKEKQINESTHLQLADQ